MREKRPDGQLNNKGFSLIELIIAIVILSIIVTPLLHSFVTAARTNGKARNTMHATAVAENVMEEFEAHSIEEMRRKYDAAGYTQMPGIDEDISGYSGSFRFEGSDEQGTSIGTTSIAYDVEVVLDPSAYSDNINGAKMADIQNLAGSLNAVYTEAASEAEDAYGYFQTNSAGTYTREQIAANTTKTIQLKIKSNPVSLDLGEGEILTTNVYLVTASVQYHCDTSMLMNPSAGNYPPNSSDYIIFSNESAVKEQAAAIKDKKAAGTYDPAVDKVVSRLANIILCLQPRYGAGEDMIYVNNSDNVDTSLYLVRQNLSGAEESALTTAVRNSYKVHYRLTEHRPGWMSSQGASFTSHCVLRTNLLEHSDNISYEFYNASNGSSIQGKAYLDRDPVTGENVYKEGIGTIGGCNALTIMQADTLAPLRSYNRMYDITVNVYAKGTIGTAGPLVTMTGTVTDE